MISLSSFASLLLILLSSSTFLTLTTTSKAFVINVPFAVYRTQTSAASRYHHDQIQPIARTTTSRSMSTSAYGGTPSDGTKNVHLLSHLLPYQTTLPKNGRSVEVSTFHPSEWDRGMSLMNLIIREGKTWPFDNEFQTLEDYRGYFLSHAAFVVRALDDDDGLDNEGNVRSGKKGDVMGCFYVKPNFPGRCSHVCNGGFITAPEFRRMGVAKLMGHLFLRFARDLGYKSSYFNLVFESNVESVKLWEGLGFERVATLENCAKLEGEDGLVTAFGYRYDLETLPKDYLPPGDKKNEK